MTKKKNKTNKICLRLNSSERQFDLLEFNWFLFFSILKFNEVH